MVFKINKRLLAAILFISMITASLLLPMSTHGAATQDIIDGAKIVAPIENKKSINDYIATAINVFSVIIGIAAVFMIIIGGYLYITSGGDSKRVNDAKNMILYAVVGLVVVSFAQIIVIFVVNKLNS